MFGEVSFAATDKLSFTAGARWFEYEVDNTQRQGALLAGSQPNLATDYFNVNETTSTKDSDWVPKLNVTYQFSDDAMGYATYSEGFRLGGSNLVRVSSVLPRSYDPDKLKNYEIGFKSSWLDDSLRFNSVLYRMDWEDMQIQVNDPDTFSLGVVNFSQAQVDGFETEITWIPAEGWDITANGAWINAEISEDDVITGEDGVIVAEVANGTQLPITPEYKASLGVQYTFRSQLLGAEPYVRIDWSYVGDSVNSLDGTESIVFTQGPTDQPSYDIGNIRVGLEADKWSGTLFVDNVTDEVAQAVLQQSLGHTAAHLDQPAAHRWRDPALAFLGSAQFLIDCRLQGDIEVLAGARLGLPVGFHVQHGELPGQLRRLAPADPLHSPPRPGTRLPLPRPHRRSSPGPLPDPGGSWRVAPEPVRHAKYGSVMPMATSLRPIL